MNSETVQPLVFMVLCFAMTGNKPEGSDIYLAALLLIGGLSK